VLTQGICVCCGVLTQVIMGIIANSDGIGQVFGLGVYSYASMVGINVMVSHSSSACG
jgi:hypothetical protein